MAKRANRVFRQNITTIFGLCEVKDTAEKSKGGVGLSFAVLVANLQMAFGYQGRRDLVYRTPVPGLEVNVEVALVVVLRADCQLSDRLECRVCVRKRWRTFRDAARIDAALHIL